MHQEKYSLSWQAYSDHLREMMQEIMNDDFADVTLISEDKKQIKAHKNIVSACSLVLKDIVNIEGSTKSIIYLKGINFSELESIMQFIYLGEATFYEERMDDFLEVARSLEIKELCKAKRESNDALNDEPLPNDPVTSNENSGEEKIKDLMNMESKDNMERREALSGNYECDMCHKGYTNQGNLYTHIQSVHEGVKYSCNQCEYQASRQSHLKRHINSIHEGIKYACDQCDYQVKRQEYLKTHIKFKHEGVKYTCSQCEYQTGRQDTLRYHIQAKHEGNKYLCEQCDYKTSWQGNLKKHISSKHVLI